MEYTIEKQPFKRYEVYKDSGVEWIGEVPEHWEVSRIKNVVKMLVSNVDKLTKKLEEPVRLCNYVDVFKNDAIHSGLSFMKATASKHEIEKFRIRYDDVIITKDSEDWKEIGVPSIVKYEAEDLICGYHLAILRPQVSIHGPFLNRLFQSRHLRWQLSVKANGITRYGISHGSIQDAITILPPLPEQQVIARFLDQKCAQIDKAIAQKERLIELLKERQQIIIQQAVTKGLDPQAKMKDSGVEWIGEVPEDWELVYNRRLFRENNRYDFKESELSLSLSQVDGVIPSDKMKERSLAPAHRNNFKLCLSGDLVVNRFKGHLGVFFRSNYRGLVTFHYGVFEPSSFVNTKYYELLYHTDYYKIIYAGASNGMTIGLQNLSNQNFYDVKSLVPPLEVQNEIVNYCESLTSGFEGLIKTQLDIIQKLKEYKSILIDQAVTGKIKVN
ncbi:MAG: restriction endonuclease subunit S [Bacteroidota bacterium]